MTTAPALQPSATPVDLRLPLYGASFGAAFSRFFRKYAVFSGRASRSEYWYAALALVVLNLIPLGIYIAGGILSSVWASENGREGLVSRNGQVGTGVVPAPLEDAPAFPLLIIGGLLLVLLFLVVLVPSIAVAVRRLHDANLSGLLYLLTFIPSVGPIILLVLVLLPSKPEGSRFDRV